MARNFYFGADADIVAGSDNFATLISSGPTTYGLVAAQSTAFGLLNTALQSAYTTAITPETRTSVSISAKLISWGGRAEAPSPSRSPKRIQG